MPAHNQDETSRIEKKQPFFTVDMVKVVAACFAVGLPWFVWATVSVFSLQADCALIRQRQDTIHEIKRDIETIKTDLGQLRTDVAILKSKGTP